MKKNKGFTLVELLAVIAILAILVIIALPNVMGMFNDAKKKSFITEVKEVFKVAEQTWMSDSMFSTSEQVYSRCETCTGKSLDLTGRKQLSYYIKIDKSGKVVKYYATDGTYQYRYDGSGLLITDITNAEAITEIDESNIVIIQNNDANIADPVPPTDNMLMAGTNGIATTNYLRTTIFKQYIETLTFTNTLDGHTANGTNCWDVSVGRNGSVLAWVVDSDSNGKYEMTIGANGTVYASSGNSLFSYLTNLNSLNGLNYLNTSHITDMTSMFFQTGLNSPVFTLDLGSNFDTSRVTKMTEMFSDTGMNSPVFTLDLGDKFNTSQVTQMSKMFYRTGLYSTVFTLNLGSKFDTSQIKNMQYMFTSTGYTSPVFTLNLGPNFDTSKVTNMSYMFHSTGYSNRSFTLDLGPNFDTSQVTNMQSMFSGSRYLKTIYAPSSFVTTNVTSSTDMFTNCNYLVGGSGTTYNANGPHDKTYAHIDGGVSNPGYFTRK